MLRQIIPLLLVLLLIPLIGCEEHNDAIDETFTFNIAKDTTTFFPAATPTGVLLENNDVILAPIPSDIVGQRTTFDKLLTAKFTRLAISFSDPTYTLRDGVDTIIYSVRADTLPERALAYYSPSSDSMHYGNADIVKYLYDPSTKWKMSFQLRTSPPSDITAALSYTYVLTSKYQ
jgi:hypothetical protein